MLFESLYNQLPLAAPGTLEVSFKATFQNFTDYTEHKKFTGKTKLLFKVGNSYKPANPDADLLGKIYLEHTVNNNLDALNINMPAELLVKDERLIPIITALYRGQQIQISAVRAFHGNNLKAILLNISTVE